MNVSLKIPSSALDMNNYPLPEGKSKHEYSVNGIKGLRIVISTKSTTFLWRYSFTRKKCSMVLGKYPEISIYQAIELITQYQVLLDKGINPDAEQRRQQSTPTFAYFVTNIYLPAVQPYKRSYKDDESRIRTHLIQILGKLLINGITVPMVSSALIECQQKGLSNATVNRIRALLSSIFNMAIEHEWITTNPVSRVRKFKENNLIERYLNDTEMQRLDRVLIQPAQFSIDNLIIVAIVRFLLLTGVRKREAMDLQWSDVDTETGVWLLKHNKAGKARQIPLSSEALKIICSMPKRCPYVFANPETLQPYADIRKTFEKILKAADIDKIRIHDLRHNFASMAVNSGESLYVVQKLLGHSSPITTQRYAHVQHDTLRNASEKIAQSIRQTNRAS
ncbi:tyrosine-type recombinase/integrase [Acinetobacter sp. VNH17]|uniref:Tyrosine-type recombinase/integrase n=1 Tax=Acinetobacter thutiue TaxID=2998078 RepID=A0ABT7WQK4_9GAMM|nr:site-specific integrase [Acinetobacter thutiue]MCY6412854.1 tyrosine-type recombinase/integrase [Acinetobacter thutiue]MDN0014961.1 tyrosine-type recombinase/integrase [Acinetobacter thutiue]